MLCHSMNKIPFNPISAFYQKQFGQKVYKIPVAVVEDCPNRQGLKGMETCIFCDPWGSAARSEMLLKPLKEQIFELSQHIQKKHKNDLFLVYFQAYTNTFSKLNQIQANFDTALSFDFVKGLVIGTRPDCISPAVLNLWKDYSEKTFVSVELGVQSFQDKTLQFLKRGHTAKQSIHAIEKIKKLNHVDIGIHLILGTPNETDQHIIDMAKLCNSLQVSNVKLHNLHVLKKTTLESLYNEGRFEPIELQEYARRVCLFLEHLSPEIYLHRLAAFASRGEELISPLWTANKMYAHQFIIDYINDKGSFQGSSI